jgi:hypothetical protein
VNDQPADDLANQGLDALPDAPEGEPFDPLAELSLLTQANAMQMNELMNQGVVLNDSHPMITQMIHGALLEEILRTVAGDGAVVRILLETHQQIADVLKNAESQIRKAKIVGPVHDGRVTRPGHLT